MSKYQALRRGRLVGPRVRRVVVSTLVVAAAMAAGASLAGVRDGGLAPRVVGHGCAGSSGPLWAAEEDHLPGPCARVERW